MFRYLLSKIQIRPRSFGHFLTAKYWAGVLLLLVASMQPAMSAAPTLNYTLTPATLTAGQSYTISWSGGSGTTYVSLACTNGGPNEPELPRVGQTGDIAMTSWVSAPPSCTISAVNSLNQATRKTFVMSTAAAPVKNAQFLGHSFPTVMYVGETYNVSVTMLNNGNTTWTSGEQYLLGIAGADVWSRGRVALTQNVPPGSAYTFQTTVVAPSTNIYYMQWRMLREGDTWFGESSPLTQVNVTPRPPANASSFVSQVMPSRISPGMQGNYSVTLKNTGTATWTAAQGYKLAVMNGATWSGARGLLTSDVPPNGTFTFTGKITAPALLGDYPIQWKMLRAETEWFGAETPSVLINVASPEPIISFQVAQTNTGGRLLKGTTTLNSGLTGTTWTKVARDTVNKVELREGSAVLATVRPTVAWEDTVPATVRNDVATVDLRANFAEGTHQVYLRTTTHAGNTLDSPLYTVTVLPAPVYGAELVGVTGIPTEMAAGATANIAVTTKNKSNLAWTAAEGYKLGSKNPDNNTTWGLSRVELSGRIEVNQDNAFAIAIKAPATPGTYNLQWQMLQEGADWFGPLTNNTAIVVKYATQTALTTSTTSAVAGSAVTLTAAVSGNSPTGNVVFYDGAKVLATKPLISGSASYTSPSLSNGTHTITAKYVGSTSHFTSVSPAVAVTWAKIPTTTALSTSAAAPPVGTSVTLTATLTGNPSGSVAFKEGSTILATKLISNGVATYVTRKLAGTHTFTAVYPDGVSHSGSASQPVTVTWQKATTTTGITASTTAPYTFTASVVGSNSDSVPTGKVNFMDGSTSLGSVPIINGSANFLVLGMSAGAHTVTAVYGGDAANNGSSSVGKQVSVGPRTSSTYDGAIQRTTYAVMSGDVNADGQNDMLFKAQPGAVAPSSPTFALVSSAYGVYSLVVNPAAGTLNAPAWKTATQQVVYGGPDGSFAGWIKITAANDTQANFIVAMAADTGNLFIASVTAPVVDTTGPASSATPIAVDIEPPELDSENAGTLPGSLAVSNSGAATYSIPVVVPPGTAGLQPTLSLNYSSQGQNGILGLGWSLGGLSSIGRCGKTIAQDNVNDRINFSVTDRLCLDGQRLVLVNAAPSDVNYWSATAEYRTEIESFNRIRTKFVVINGQAVRSFEVWSKDGRISTYGSTPDSYVNAVIGYVASGYGGAQPAAKNGPQSWAIDSIKDRSGNFIKVTYKQDDATGEHLPTFIRYGGSGLASHAAVQFSYEARPDAWKRYIDETRNDLRSRVNQIKTYVGSNLDGDVIATGKVARAYSLHYDISQTSGRSLLDAVQVSARNPNTNEMESMRPTKFDWGKPDPAKQAGFESKGIWPGAPVLTVNNYTAEFGNRAENRAEYFAFNDFNADGLSDVLEKRVAAEYVAQFESRPTLEKREEAGNPNLVGTKKDSYRYFHNNGNGFTQYAYRLNTGEQFVVLGVGDFDGDGKLDLFAYTTGRPDSGTKICLSPLGTPGSLGAAGSEIIFNCKPRVGLDDWNNTPNGRAYVFDPLGDGRSGAYSAVRESNGTRVATFCTLAGCKLDTDPPGTLGTTRETPTLQEWVYQMPELKYTSLSQSVDLAGFGRPYDVRWSEAKWLKRYADGREFVPETWEWVNFVPTITVTSLGGPDSANKIGNFASYSHAPVPFIPSTIQGNQGSPGYRFDHSENMPGLTADFNGSGYSSLAFGFLQLGRQADKSMYIVNAETTICLSTGRALDCGVRLKYSGAERYRQVYAVGDFVGDGLSAIMVRPLEAQPAPSRPWPGTAVEMCRVTGDDSTNGTGTDDLNINCAAWPGMSMPPDNASAMPLDAVYSMDLLGTGRPQMVVYHSGRYINGTWVPGSGWELFSPIDMASDGQALDRIHAATNGLGATDRVEYADGLTSGIVRLTGNHPLAYPLRSAAAPGKIVSKLKVDSGGGNVQTISYLYEDLASDASGRESPGFAVLQNTNEQTGMISRTELRQDWPYIGMTKSSTLTDRNGVVLSSLSNSYGTELLGQADGTSTRCPVLRESINIRRDLSDPEHGNFVGYDLATTTSVNTYTDGWCNVNRQSTTVIGGDITFNRTTTTDYLNDGGNWLIGLPKTSVISKTDSSSGLASLPRTVKNEYDGNGLLYTQTVEPDDVQYRVVVTHTRSGNPFGLVNIKTTDWRDPATNSVARRTEQIVYEPNGRFAGTVTNALGQSEMNIYDAGTGVRTSLIGPNGLATLWIVDGFGRVTVEKRADGNETRMHQKFCVICPSYAVIATISEGYNGSDRVSVPQVSYSDSSGNVLRKMSWGFDGRQIVTDMRYDALGRLAETDHPRFDSAGAVLHSRQFYDDMNRVTRVQSIDAGNAVLTTSTQYEGLTQTLTNALSQQRVETRDALGQLRKVVQKRTRDGANVGTIFAYDAFGSLAQTIDPNKNVITVSYDKLGRKTDLHDPDLGHTHYDVDPLGQVWQQISPKQRAAGKSTTFSFDLLGRLTARLETDLKSFWVFDQQPESACAVTHSCGQLVEAYTLAGSSKDYVRLHTYDELGRARTNTEVIGDGTANGTFRSSVDYDSWGRPMRSTYQRNADVAKVFDSRYNNMGYLERLERGAQVLWRVVEQDAANRTTKTVFGNGLTQSFVYNVNTDWLESATLTTGAGSLQLLHGYAYDQIGNVSSRTQYWDQGGFLERFEYDELNRLRLSAVGLQTQNFTYDDAGNIKSRTGGSGVGGTSYVYPPQGNGAVRPHAVQQIDGGVAYRYDDNGNMISGPGRDYTWTSFDMPLSITKASTTETVSSAFVYGPEHQRTRQTRGDGSVEVYAGAQVTERTNNGVLTVKTYWPYGVGVEIDVAGKATELNWLHADRLGSPVAISERSGLLIEKLAYDAWGKRRTTTGTNLTPDELNGSVDNRGFTGHEMLDQLDLVHMNGRIYDPAIGRFISADPILQDPINGQSYNRYSYVLNNPTNLIDPTGFTATCGKSDETACDASGGPEKKDEKSKDLGCAKGQYCGQKGTLVFIGNGEGGLDIHDTSTAEGRAGLNSAGFVIVSAKKRANSETGFSSNFKNGFVQGVSDKSHSQGYPDVTDGDTDKGSLAYLLGMGVGHAFVNNAGTGGRMSLGPSHGNAGRPAGAGAVEPDLLSICFVAGTSVHTSAGIRNIEDIQAGDMVYSVQPGTNELMQRPVVRVFKNLDGPIIRVTVGDGTGRLQEFGVTPEHPFWVVEKGWVPAGELQSGNALLALDQVGWHVIGVVDNGERANTFNFEVQDLHNYFVGEKGILVHNNSKIDVVSALSKSRNLGPVFKTNTEAAKAAAELGFRKTNFQSSGQAVFTDGKYFITRDVDGHNGGAWKMGRSAADLTSKSTRLGTYDISLKRIGD